jgi:2,3-bisphosphoglycerate-independent phosphoglycerate mutase
MTFPKPVVLCVLDGWGHSEEASDNAILLANTPNWKRWEQAYPSSLLEASGEYVGLPNGQMGNSEVGHMSIGAGRIIFQDLPRIHRAIQTGEFESLPVLQKFVHTIKQKGASCHLMGLLSPGGVHSHQDHIVALAKFLNKHQIQVMFHGWLDGRDTPPKSAISFLKTLLTETQALPLFKVVTIGGRYYGMDRDKRWERIQVAYEAMVEGKGKTFQDPIKAIEKAYQDDITDEFIPPMVLEGYQGMIDGDGILVANFRADRVRQILTAFLDPHFSHFSRRKVPSLSMAVGMTEYSKALNPFMETLFPPEDPRETLGEVISEADLKQLRIAETEKYAHVTFFFNGGREEAFKGEDRVLIPSPKVATYDLKPEMSAFEMTNQVVQFILENKYDFIVVNYANPDMVGHTGNMSATLKAIEAVDLCLGKLEKAVLSRGGILMVTADHGNAEQMEDINTHQPHTAHTCNLVPFVVVSQKGKSIILKDKGGLADIAPTVLDLINLPIPKDMKGISLIQKS